MRLISLGDNTADCYYDEHIFFPGGQAINVAVDAKADGAEKSSYLGIFGDDAYASYLRQLLDTLDVGTDRCRVVYADTPRPGIRIVNGERSFLHSPITERDCYPHLVKLSFSPRDFDLLSTFDVCHTTNEADVDSDLFSLHQAVKLSYDFSTDRSERRLQRVCPHIDLAFFSGEGLDESEVRMLISAAHGCGCPLVVMTMGVRGSICSDGTNMYEQGITSVNAIDTLGAGDSYAAAFLVRYFDTYDIQAAMVFASECSAKTCTIRGAFGHSGSMI